MSYGVVRTDNMYATDVRGGGLVSIKYIVTENAGQANETKTETAIENGCVLKIGDLMDGQREVYEGTAPAKGDALGDLCLIATPELMYDERKHDLDEFINEAGKIARGYRFHHADTFSLTADAFETALSEIAVGNIIELQNNKTKMKVVASATASTTTVGKIIAIEQAGKYTYYVICVA